MSRELHALVERPRVRRLNHRPVGDRVAVGDAHFAQARPAGDELLQHRGGERHVGIARRDKRHQRLAVRGAEVGEELVDGFIRGRHEVQLRLLTFGQRR